MNTWIVPRQVVRSNVEAMDRWAGDADRALREAGLAREDIERGKPVRWDEFSRLMNAFGESRSDDELVAFGEEYVHAFPGFREMASLFVSPTLLYRFVVRASPRYWSELDFDVAEEGSRAFRVRAQSHAGSSANRPFFASSIGMFRNLATLVGAEPASVTVHGVSTHHCAFTLEVTPSKDLRERLREARVAREAGPVFDEMLALTAPPSERQAAATGLAPSVYELKVRWGFTVAEARLARRLAGGKSLQESARDLGIRHETARSHLKHVLEKTGVGRQADLVRTLLG
jgi:DNA-binding CsgD family transcriptional regulator